MNEIPIEKWIEIETGNGSGILMETHNSQLAEKTGPIFGRMNGASI